MWWRSVVSQNLQQKNWNGEPVIFFSLLDAEKGLQDVDIAIYLVHSMRPSAQLVQGTFDDFDLILADNFVRAAEKCQVKQIIYLGGMRTEEKSEEDLPLYLRSRLEVESIFCKSVIPSTVLRAAMILGPDGVSFQIISHLVRRARFMICPAWMNTPLQPMALKDVVVTLNHCVAKSEVFDRVS